MHPLLIIAVRIGGLFLILQFINGLFVFIPSYVEGKNHFDNFFLMALYSYIPPLIHLAIGLILWFKPNKVLQFFVKEHEIMDTSSIDWPGVQTLLISSIGIYIIVNSVTDLVYYLSMHLTLKEDIGFTYQVNPETKAGIIASLFKFILGLFLIVKSNYITSSLMRMTKK